MVWSSTTVDVSHMHPSLVCVRGSHVHSKHVICCKVSKSFGVGMLCQLRTLCKRRWERGMALGMMSLHNNHLAHAWWYTALCAMSHHAHLSFFSEPRMEQCCSQEWLLCLWCQCFHVQSNCLGKHLPQCFHESALKVHMVHCDSLATLALVCWLCMKRNLVCNAP